MNKKKTITMSLADLIVRDVAELPDRDSPEDWPEAMLVTDEELRNIINERLGDRASQAEAIRQDILTNHLPRIAEGLQKGYADENQVLVVFDHLLRMRLLTAPPA